MPRTKTATPKGNAALYQGLGKGFTVEELPTPEVESGGILVRVTATSICGSDLHYWRGDSRMAPESLPRITGHEFTGYVHSLGKGVTTDSLRRPLKEGDRVAFPFFFPCLRCYQCIRGEFNCCPHRARRNMRLSFKEYPYCDGGFAEYFLLPSPHFVFKVPDELPNEAIAPVNCALSQVTFGLHQARVRFGDTVVVQGAGGLGVYAAAVAKEMGAVQVISIDGQTPRLELVNKCGATHTIDLKEYKTPEERIKRVQDLTGSVGADIVVEVTGIPQAIPEGLKMLRKGGSYVEIGNITPGPITLDMSIFTSTQTRILGTTHYDPGIIPEALDFLVQTVDKYPLTKVVSHKFPLDKINEAFKTAEWVGREGGSQVTRAIVTP